jgi:hypothetical protein
MDFSLSSFVSVHIVPVMNLSGLPGCHAAGGVSTLSMKLEKTRDTRLRAR